MPVIKYMNAAATRQMFSLNDLAGRVKPAVRFH